MAHLTLTKAEKKIARKVIDKGLQKEYINGILELDAIISKWKTKKFSNRDTWAELYGAVKTHDKHLALQYDYLTGSKYVSTIARQLMDEVIDSDDLADFSEDVRERIIHMSRIND